MVNQQTLPEVMESGPRYSHNSPQHSQGGNDDKNKKQWKMGTRVGLKIDLPD